MLEKLWKIIENFAKIIRKVNEMLVKYWVNDRRTNF